MLQVSSLYKAYGSQVIFEDVGFTVNSGERVGLVGRNGHGKTTLFRMILGEEHPDSGCISVPNNYSVGHLSQHLSFSEDSVLNEGCLSLPENEDGLDETYKVKAILMGLGFTEAQFIRPPQELSGGYQVRLNLAKVLIREPNLLLLDEPTNYLDILSVRWLIQFLRNWKNELILITHDRDFMDSVVTHTMGIHRLKMRKIAGPTWKLYEQIAMEEEVYEQTRISDDKKRKETEDFINRFRAKATKAKAVQSRVKALERKGRLEKQSSIKKLDFEFNAAPFSGKWLMEADNISFSYNQDGPPLINGLSLSVAKEDRIAIIGKNGKGKTTLLNMLAGEMEPLAGTVRHSPKLKLAYFGQTNINRLDPQKTVEDEIIDALPEYNRRVARNICGVMMFEGDKALKKVDVLSGGEKSRVLLGKLLAGPANLLLLDEPTNHLDMDSIDSLLEAINEFDGGVMIVTHSELILNEIATKLIVFDRGNVSVFNGTYQDFLERVGWTDETQAAAPACSVSDRSKGINRKDARRMRAGIITDRSRALGALQNRIKEIEETIVRLEKAIERDTQSVIEASEKGDWKTGSDLTQSIHKAKEEVDSLFDELGTLSAELNDKSREFDEKLNELDMAV